MLSERFCTQKQTARELCRHGATPYRNWDKVMLDAEGALPKSTAATDQMRLADFHRYRSIMSMTLEWSAGA